MSGARDPLRVRVGERLTLALDGEERPVPGGFEGRQEVPIGEEARQIIRGVGEREPPERGGRRLGRGRQKSASSFIFAYTPSSSGMNTCSSAPENGMAGMSGPAIRTMGPSRSNMHSSAMVAEISAPAP